MPMSAAKKKELSEKMRQRWEERRAAAAQTPPTLQAPMGDAPLPPEPSHDMIVYTEGYLRGKFDGRREAANLVLQSLGFTLTEARGGEDSDHPPTTPEDSISESEGEPDSSAQGATVPPPPPSPSERCERCGHTKEEHFPLSSKSCFAKGCSCGGYSDKKGVKIGPFRIG